MEKLFVFGPMIIFLVFFGLLIIGFFVLVFKLVKRGKAAAWVGIVQDKKYFEKEDKEIGEKIGRKEHFYNLVVKMENGETHTIAVNREFYDTIKPGDKLEKKSGELWPKKV
jgi:hypothetical protein